MTNILNNKIPATLDNRWLETPNGILNTFGKMNTEKLIEFMTHFNFQSSAVSLKEISTKSLKYRINQDLSAGNIIYDSFSNEWNSNTPTVNRSEISKIKTNHYLNLQNINSDKNLNTLYVLTTKNYLSKSIFKGQLSFPMKIGITKRPVQKRIRDLSTGSPSELICLFNYSVAEPKIIEKKIHSILRNSKLGNRIIGSQEWFYINLKEFRDALHSALVDNSEEHILRVYGSQYA
jgi:hypothetical protein